MASALKCPNPSCPYLFDPTTVPPGVILACPRCGMRFTLGPPLPPPSAPSPPEAAGTVTFPAPGARAAPPPPDAAEFGDMMPAAARPDGEGGPRPPVRGSKFQTAVLVAVAAVALSAAGVAVWWKLSHKDDPHANAGQVFKDENLYFESPPAPWARDEDTRAKLGHPFRLVYRRENPEAFMAFGIDDFRVREPRTRDLDKPLTRTLAKLAERDTLKMYLDDEDVEPSWLGQPARRRFKFTGVLKAGGTVEGQAIAVSYKGIGYWFLSWTGSADIYAEQKGAFAAARKRLRLLDLRDKWAEQQPTIVPFKGDTVPYTISDGEGVWKEVTDPADRSAQDPKADKFLRAQVKEPGRDFGRDAELLVLVLDAEGGDPLEQGRRYVEGMLNRDVTMTGKVTFEPHAENRDFDPPNPVPGNAPYVLLKGTNERSRQARLWAVSAVRVGDKTVVAAATCPFAEDERREFERPFVELVKSLQPRE